MWHFERAAQDANKAKKASDQAGWERAIMRMDSLCTMATRDLWHYQRPGMRLTSPTDAENVDRLLTDWQGIPAHEVAVWEMCSVAWVRRSRQNAGFEPELGEEKLKDGRMLKILKLKEAGMSQREIAREIGVSAMTVSRALAAA